MKPLCNDKAAFSLSIPIDFFTKKDVKLSRFFLFL